MSQEEKFAPVIDNYHGTEVEDRFRWLENPEDEAVQQWVDEQNIQTESFLEKVEQRGQIKEKLTALWNYEKFTVPQKEGTAFYIHKNDGLQNQAVFYRSKDEEFTDLEVIIDPNTLNDKGTAAITNLSFSKNGDYLAYGISYDGSDWQEIHIKNLQTLEDASEVLKHCKFSSIAWNEEGTGFYYNRFKDPATVTPEEQSYYNRVYWHTVGTSQEDDELIYADDDNKEFAFNPEFSSDYRYLLLTAWRGTENRNRIYVRDEQKKGDFQPLLAKDDGEYRFITSEGSVFYFQTNKDAPKERVIAIDVNEPAEVNWQEVIPEADDVLSHIACVNEQFVALYLHNAYDEMRLFEKDGTYVRDLALPKYTSVTGLSGKKMDTAMYISYTSYLAPTKVLKYTFDKDETTVLMAADALFPTEAFETTQVFYPSKDGTQIPMFLTHKKGITLDGENPVLLYGYGGFNVSLTPTFSPSVRMWLEAGGVYAVANIRGGGEFGEEWYKAGTLAQKQNVFDDFIAAAECLVGAKYTTPAKLAIMGGSNGGLLVSACMTQRPELYGAVICQVPVTDMLRYHKFTVGRYWVTDFGNAEENADDFDYMIQYSPLHNVRQGVKYPATLITTADTDDRVVPLHAKKFAATVQEAQGGEAPIFIRIEKNAGHGLGKPTYKVIEEATDIYTFLFKMLDVRL